MIINMNGAKAPETPSPVLQEKTITPETLPTVIGADEGYDGLSQVTVNPDSQLKAENIRSGKSIFGVEGVFEGVNTGDALTSEQLLNVISTDGSIARFVMCDYPVTPITYIKDEITDSESDYLNNAGLLIYEGAVIGGPQTPLAQKLTYNGAKYAIGKATATRKLTSSSATSGKVSGTMFNKEYTGNPIYYAPAIINMIKYQEIETFEYGIFEADVHVEGYVTISSAPNASTGMIISGGEFPKAVSADIHVKLKLMSSSNDTGIIDITGLPTFTVENYSVGYQYGKADTFYLIMVITKAWLLTTPVKTEVIS